jgi:nucleoside-diphosphate-sugar epimerase
MERTVLVTGGSGFVGHHLVRACIARGDRVRALVRATSRTSGLEGAELVRGDLATGEGLREAVTGVDVVLHLAGLVKALAKRDFFRVNEGGTRGLAVACRDARARPRRFVLVSSLAAAGPARTGRPRLESDPPRPVSWYGRSKLAGERALAEEAEGYETTIVRPPAVYGPRDTENAAFLETLSAGWAVRFRGALERLSMIEVGDLVEAILLAADAPAAAGRTYFASHPEVLTLEEMLGLMARALDVEPRTVTLPGAVVRIAGGISHAWGVLSGKPPMLSLFKVPELLAREWTCDPSRAARELGWSARTPAAVGVGRFVGWWRNEGGGRTRPGPARRV